MEKRLFDVEDIAEYLGATKGAIYSWVCDREIPYVKIGRLTKFDLAVIDEWIAENSVGVKVKPEAQDIDAEIVREVLGHKPKEKPCGTCKEKKRLDQFYKDKRCKDGRVKHCKECMKKAGQERWALQKEKRKAEKEKKKKAEEEKKKVPWAIGGKFEQRNEKNEVIFKDGVPYGKEGEEWLARMKMKYARRGE